jgi:hypothetical protein
MIVQCTVTNSDRSKSVWTRTLWSRSLCPRADYVQYCTMVSTVFVQLAQRSRDITTYLDSPLYSVRILILDPTVLVLAI